MTITDISKANDPDLRASIAAMQRAAELARKIAIQTDTHLVIMEDEKLVRLSADELRRIDNRKPRLRGALKDYADPSLIAEESTAWQETANDS